MQDRPTALELLAAVRDFVTRHVVPALDGSRRFHARVAANVLAIVERELRDADAQLCAEWAGLRVLCVPGEGPSAALDDDVPPADPGVLRAAVADAGAFRDAVLRHLRAMVADKLRIANPAYLEEERR
jgi:hypothetical protein